MTVDTSHFGIKISRLFIPSKFTSFKIQYKPGCGENSIRSDAYAPDGSYKPLNATPLHFHVHPRKDNQSAGMPLFPTDRKLRSSDLYYFRTEPAYSGICKISGVAVLSCKLRA